MKEIKVARNFLTSYAKVETWTMEKAFKHLLNKQNTLYEALPLTGDELISNLSFHRQP